MSEKMCDDCFDEFEPIMGNQDICGECAKSKYSADECSHIWKVQKDKKFESEVHVKEYQVVKLAYMLHTGNELPKLEERI